MEKYTIAAHYFSNSNEAYDACQVGETDTGVEVNAGDINNPLDPAESSWLSSTSSTTSSNTSTGSTISKGSVDTSPNNSEFDDSALKIHLKAMRIHKQKVLANRQRDDLDVASALEKERLVALTHLSKHAQTWSPGQAHPDSS
jgi:hypothetical protein